VHLARKRKFVLIAALSLLVLGAVYFPHIRLGVLTALFIQDILDEKTVSTPQHGTLAWVTPTPVVKSVLIPHDAREIRADLYYLPNEKKRAAILLTHGIVEEGKDDPRLVRFAHSLARAGFVVLVPELAGMKALKVVLSDVDDIVTSFRYLEALNDLVDDRKMGLLGFSYAAGPTLMAAAHPAIRHRVKFVTTFGGYYDPVNVIRFITTGYYEYRNEKGFLNPEPYGKWVFFVNNLDYVESPKDRELLKEIFRKEQEQKRDQVRLFVDQLTPQGKYLYELLINEDPKRVGDLVQKIDPRVRRYLEKLSMAPIIPSVDAYFIIGHGSGDPLIPYTESLRLADAVRDKSQVHVVILRLFTHVDPARKRFSLTEFFTVRLPSMMEFYFLVYDLLRQQW